MELEAVLKKILDRFNDDFQESSRIRALEKIISEGADQYKYAEEMAREVGKILNGALRTYLPEALTNGMLYRKAAEVVLKQPMLKAVKPVSDAASSVQKNINAQAGIGINPIIPEVNEDQVNGIITGICNAESYESGKETLFDQVENFLEGHVDDSVHDNAGFQYEAGLDPTVTRSAAAKCCKWCDQLAGTYDYEKVRNKGNDVWRRHKNCHCVIDYNPGTKQHRYGDSRRFRSTQRNINDKILNNLGMVQTGGYSGAKKMQTQKQRNDHADRYYEEIRKRKPYADANIIVKRVNGFTTDDIEDIRQHVFIKKVRRDGGLKRFDPDYNQAQVWQRLTTGQPLWDSDITMLEHERMELNIMRETGCEYEEAHEKTQKVFNWWAEFEEEKKRRGK